VSWESRSTDERRGIMNRSAAASVILGSLAAISTPARAQAPRVELDHVFIVVKPGALPEIAALRSAGLTVLSEPRKHAGQGTASTAVYFENAYLELIWVDSTVPVDAEHAATFQWFRNAEAWQVNGRSPFGMGLRRLPGDTMELPVPVRREFAEWLPAGSSYELLHQPSDTLAADFFVVPASNAVPNWVGRARTRFPASFRHQGGGRAITLVRIHGAPEHVPAAFPVLRPKRIDMVRAPAPLLELHLDDGIAKSRADLRPVLPLVIVR
jgi:hypothetical protein